MPYLEKSSYKGPRWLPEGHSQTIFPVLFRRVPDVPFQRTLVETPDGDFFDLDFFTAAARKAWETEQPGNGVLASISHKWKSFGEGGWGRGGRREPLLEKGFPPSPVNSFPSLSPKGIVILSHGLEGHSRRTYMRGMCLALTAAGWDCAARNFRACGGGMNRSPGMYHSGQTQDLHAAVEHCLGLGYRRIVLAGFSMGGNQTLKYLGEDPDKVPAEVAGAAAFSVPCDLAGSAAVLDKPANQVYMRYFLRTLREKVREKHARYPELYPLEGLEDIRTFGEFDGRYTAPVHGFASARDYWEKSSCLDFLPRIRVPALLVNATNDPFLSPSCFPADVARGHSRLFLETPEAGGHMGFPSGARAGNGCWWPEERTLRFLESLDGDCQGAAS